MMDIARLRRFRMAPALDGAQAWYCEATPAEELAWFLGLPELAQALPVEKPEAEVIASLNEAFGEATAAQVIGAAELGDRLSSLLQEGVVNHDGEEFDDEAPVIRMINAILQEAVSRKASDIHLEPYEQESVVRFRVDGLLRDVAHPPRTLHAALISRIKVMAQLDIAEKRLPQDGRMTVRGGSGVLDIRVSTLPTGQGERAVLRLLDKGQARLSLEALGMAQDTLQTVQQLIERPHGIVLVTGPTGSGKTTTLYAALSRLDAASRNIMTVEDPIEYDMPGVSQTQVHPKIGLSFAQSLRSILRQDPDVIMIGEIRDLETAQIAIQASLTGHLVLATLHTNDAPSAVTRLLDMGVESFLLSSSLVGVMAQRLVRQTCKACAGSGCAACDATGFKGRLGIFEMLVMDDALRTAVKDRQDASEIRRLAASQGFRSLREDGERLVSLGLTTAAEVARVTELGDLE